MRAALGHIRRQPRFFRVMKRLLPVRVRFLHLIVLKLAFRIGKIEDRSLHRVVVLCQRLAYPRLVRLDPAHTQAKFVGRFVIGEDLLDLLDIHAPTAFSS